MKLTSNTSDQRLGNLPYLCKDRGQFCVARRSCADLLLLRSEDRFQSVTQYLLEVDLGVEGVGEFKLELAVHDHLEVAVGVGPENCR